MRESLGPAVRFGISFIVLEEGGKEDHGHRGDTHGIPLSFDTGGKWN